jgi:cellulose synthase/poly-beta-1,6-N-acetylglucosamine synthase-like glycosyltransferase
VYFLFAGIFWLSIFLLFQAYILYPIFLKILTSFKGKSKIEKSNYLPSVSIVISAYNEDKVIQARIENIKSLDYDFNKVELIIGSDCSTDDTNELLSEEDRKLGWMRTQIFETRRGKAAVLNDLVKLAKNDIIVFTDANTKFEKETLIKLVSRFKDEKVGGVCGRLILEEPIESFDKSNKERLYWIYETQLKKMEGDLNILVSANGGIYAIRRQLFTDFPADLAITDDLFQTMAILKQEYYFIYEFNAIAKEEISKEIMTEFKRKVRFTTTNFQTMKFFKGILFNKNFLLSFAVWSHKIIRWFVPLILIMLFVANAFLLNFNFFYYLAFLLQLGFYTSAVIGFILSKTRLNISFFGLIYYYVLTNLALLLGLLKFLTKKQIYIWDSTPR